MKSVKKREEKENRKKNTKKISSSGFCTLIIHARCYTAGPSQSLKGYYMIFRSNEKIFFQNYCIRENDETRISSK